MKNWLMEDLRQIYQNFQQQMPEQTYWKGNNQRNIIKEVVH